MRKIHALGLALFAMFAFGAFSASSAFAETEILQNNLEIKELIFFENAGELLLEDMGATGKPDILCSGIFDGMIEAGGKLGFIEEVLMSNKELLAAEVTVEGVKLAGDDVECTEGTTCSNPVLVVAVELPWHLEVVLLEATGGYMLHLLSGAEEPGKEPGYVAECKTIIGTISDYCHGLTYAVLANEPGGLLGEFSENETVTPPGNCSVGGANEGLLFGDGFITAAGGPLTVSG